MLIDPADQGPFEEKPAEAAITGVTLKSHSLWRDAFRQTLHIRSSQIGLVLLGFLLVLAVFAPLIAPYDPNEVLLSTGVNVRESRAPYTMRLNSSRPLPSMPRMCCGSEASHPNRWMQGPSRTWTPVLSNTSFGS